MRHPKNGSEIEDSLATFLAEKLETRERGGLLRITRTLESPQGPYVNIAGRRLLCLCSNDYLGLAGNLQLAVAAHEAQSHYGIGAGSSRLLAGNLRVHEEAEKALARFVNTESSLLFTSGYCANLGVLPALIGEQDGVFSDALNHASLIDGLRLCRAHRWIFPHGDLNSLEAILQQNRNSVRNAWVVTEGVFSMDGDVADLRSLRQLCDSYRTFLYVDEAHSLGLLGPQGRGACNAAGIVPDVLLGTLGKAFGLQGAFVAGSYALRAFLLNFARSFVYSTGLSPAIAGAIPTAVSLVTAADEERSRVFSHSATLRDGLNPMFHVKQSNDSPIVSIVTGSAQSALDLAGHLFSRGIYAQAIRPPTVPEHSARIRIVPTAKHQPDHIQLLLAAISDYPLSL